MPEPALRAREIAEFPGEPGDLECQFRIPRSQQRTGLGEVQAGGRGAAGFRPLRDPLTGMQDPSVPDGLRVACHQSEDEERAPEVRVLHRDAYLLVADPAGSRVECGSLTPGSGLDPEHDVPQSGGKHVPGRPFDFVEDGCTFCRALRLGERGRSQTRTAVSCRRTSFAEKSCGSRSCAPLPACVVRWHRVSTDYVSNCERVDVQNSGRHVEQGETRHVPLTLVAPSPHADQRPRR